MTAPKALNPIKVIFLTAALAFLYAGTLWKLGYDWWTDENYSHGLLIPLVIGYIIWAERKRLVEAQERPSLPWGASLVLLALLSLWVGVAGAELYVQRISFLL